MIELFFALLPLLIVVLLYVAVTRHSHNWTAWSDPIEQSVGYPVQTKRCKASSCNVYKIRRVGP